MPAVPVTFCLVMSVGAGVPGKMKSSFGGILSKAERFRFRFLESTSFYANINCENNKAFHQAHCLPDYGRILLMRGMCYLQRNFHRRKREEIRSRHQVLVRSAEFHFNGVSISLESTNLAAGMLLTRERTKHPLY